MNNIKSGQSPFKPRARLLSLLGDQLITNEVIAIVELVKNSYDADATSVSILLDKCEDPGKGEIIIEDDGSGMSLDTILNVWLEPATDFRKKQREKQKRTQKFKRVPLGEKGVGRFAAYKIGKKVEIITKTQDSKEEIVIKVDWQEFEKDNYLDEIPVTWITRKPEVFTAKNHGTKVIIKKLWKKWTSATVGNLYTKLQGLNPHFLEKTNFDIKFNATGFEETLKELPDFSEIIEKPVYYLEGEVDDNGILHFNYKFYNPAFEDLKRNITEGVSDVRDPRKFQSGRKPFCGSFTVRFYVWDLDPATLEETIRRVYYRNYVKPYTGIRIYRDGFRVWPYGEEDDDSFSLDLRRVNNPTQCLSRNQVIGIVDISWGKNPELRDKTDREGLISNKDYEDFKDLAIGCISVLEAERRQDKDKIDACRTKEKRRPGDEVHNAIDSMKVKMEKKEHLRFYESDIKKIRIAYETKKKEILEPLYVSAGLGIAYTLPVHELIRNIGDIEKLIDASLEEIKKTGLKNGIMERLKKIAQTTDIVDDLVRGVGKLTRKGKRETVSLDLVVKDAMDIMKSRLEKDKITVEFEEKEKIKIKAIKNMLITVLLNLMDNSSYWLLQRQSDRKIIIKIDRDKTGNPRIIVSDNGPGIKDDPALLVQPFYTRKPDGSGLGLYIVDRIIREAHEGKVQFMDKDQEKDLLEGANVALIFPTEEK